jgi:hypothetical protein
MTTLDLTQIAPKARERYIRIGRRYGSDDTLKQANMTLKALETHAASVVDCGFGADDVAYLAGARDALSAAGTGRETKSTEKKTTRREYLAAVAQSKLVRTKSRTILENTLVPLENDGKVDSAHKVESTLAQTNSLPPAGHDEALAAQLDLLAAALADVTIADAAKSRGGAKVLADLQKAAISLRSTAEDRDNAGTRLSTEAMDLLDGIIVTSCRAARNAAKQAARELGTPVLLTLFALPHITDTREHDANAPVDAAPCPVPTPATPGTPTSP